MSHKPFASSRPLSPHLQIYRPQLTSTLSILHRMTGMALIFGSLFLVLWLGAIAGGARTYNLMLLWCRSPLGVTFLLGWSFSFYFHCANGVRHLFWDMGWGYELKTAYRSGWVVVGISVGLTSFTAWRMIT